MEEIQIGGVTATWKYVKRDIDQEYFYGLDNTSTYQQIILAVRTVEKSEFLFSVKGQELDVIARYIETFALNASGEKIYAVQSYVQPHAFGFVVRGRLLEIDIDSGEKKCIYKTDKLIVGIIAE